MKKRRGIYIWTDSSNNQKYIGQSIDLDKRVPIHYYCNGKNSKFHNALAVRPDQFGVEIIEIPNASQETLNALEIAYIKVLNTLSPNGYNLTDGGSNGKQSIETRKKRSKAFQGKKNPMYGKKQTKQARERVSKSLIGNTRSLGFRQTEETRSKISKAMTGENNPFYGKTHSQETKDKISKVQRERIYTKEIRQRMSIAQQGKKLSKEHKAKISKSRQGIEPWNKGKRKHKKSSSLQLKFL